MNCNNNLKGRFPAEGKERDLFLQSASIPPAPELWRTERQTEKSPRPRTCSVAPWVCLQAPGQTGTREIIPGGGAFISVAPHDPLIAGPNNLPFETTTSE